MSRSTGIVGVTSIMSIIALLLAAALLGLVFYQIVASPKIENIVYTTTFIKTTTSTSTTTLTETTIPAPTRNYIPEKLFNSTFARNANGVNYLLSLNPTQLNPNNTIHIFMELNNTLPIINNVTGKSDWAYPWLTANLVCASIFDAVIFQGYYTSFNISSGQFLQSSEPGVGASCGVTSVGFSSSVFGFEPNSSTIFATNGMSSVYSANATQNFGGYWNETWSQYQNSFVKVNGTVVYHNIPYFIPFSPGIYTVAGGDQWGDLALLYFLVS